MRSARSTKRIESHFDELSWRKMHVGDDLIRCFCWMQCVLTVAMNYARESICAKKARYLPTLRVLQPTNICAQSQSMSCHITHMSSTKLQRWENCPISLWRIRHLEHARACSQAESASNSKRKKIVQAITDVRISQLIRAEPACMRNESNKKHSRSISHLSDAHASQNSSQM